MAVYIAIDLKSFYASVECVERGLDPLRTNLVVADASRTEKTICLAVSPSLKAYGIPGRARLFEVVQKVKEINRERQLRAPGRKFTGKSFDDIRLKESPELELEYITAVPRMAYYIEYSTKIFNIYLKYVSREDMHVYSVDEVFIDAGKYLKTYGMSAREFAMKMIRDVLDETGITATAGIGTNMYLCKIAMDIVAKHIPADEYGVRIAELDEMSYRKKLWNHQPLTDFWRVGKGTARTLIRNGMFTMGDVARCSEQDEDILYRLFGVNAELLIDHAWGWEPCGIKEIREYQPKDNSFSSGQVLQEPYTFEKAAVVVHEMAESAALDLLKKRMVTDQVVLTVGYDTESLTRPGINYKGPVTVDFYGRKVPKHAHGTENLENYTSSTSLICNAADKLFRTLVDPALLVRRISVDVNHVVTEDEGRKRSEKEEYIQLDFFTDLKAEAKRKEEERKYLEKEKNANMAVLEIKSKFGKNAVFKGINLKDGATGLERNNQIGGHKA